MAKQEPKLGDRAVDDAFSDVTEDSTGIFLLDVLANDRGGGGAKSLQSIDGVTSALGVTLRITADGKVAYDASTLDLEHLAAGETVEDSFTYAMRIGNGPLSWATVRLSIVGSNDGPTLSSAVEAALITEAADGTPGEGGAHDAAGAIAFGDVDSSDTHSVSFSPLGEGYFGTFSAELTDDSTGDGGGTAGWQFAVADADLDPLADGEALVQRYSVSISDGHGGTLSREVTITLTGSNDAPLITSGEQGGAVSEGDDGSSRTATGQVTFSDIDLSDTHSFSASAPSHGEASVDQDGNWTYTAFDDGVVDALAAGQVLADEFSVTVNDGHGGMAAQLVSLVITGTNDAPLVTSGEQSGAVSEGDDGSSLIATGQVTFSDVDAGDTHVFSASAPSRGEASVDQDGNWIYTAFDNGVVNALAAGQVLADEFSVTVDDGHGGTATQLVNLVITGTNDAPVVGGQTSGAVTEDGVTSASGTLSVDDPDAGESSFQAQSGLAGAYGLLNINEAGSWTYFLDNALPAVQALNAGQTLADAVNVLTADGTSQEIGITIHGASDLTSGFLDKQLTYQYLLPSITSPFGASRSFTVGDGVEVPATGSTPNPHFALNFNVDVSATSISVTYVGGVPWGFAPFNGFRITDVVDNVRDIIGVTDNSATAATTFDANNIWVNWPGARFLAGDTIVIDVAFGSSGNDPLVFDLGGDGAGFSDAVNFDLDADGHAEQIAWAGPKDGLLVMDLDASGAIENGTEVLSERFDGFGFGSSMEALRSLDTNVDGMVDASDDRFADLRLWCDADGNGVSQADELLSLGELGIVGVSVREEVRDETVDGQHVYAAGAFHYASGETGEYVGVSLSSLSLADPDLFAT